MCICATIIKHTVRFLIGNNEIRRNQWQCLVCHFILYIGIIAPANTKTTISSLYRRGATILRMRMWILFQCTGYFPNCNSHVYSLYFFLCSVCLTYSTEMHSIGHCPCLSLLLLKSNHQLSLMVSVPLSLNAVGFAFNDGRATHL